MIKLPNFLVVGSYSRNAGKTRFSTDLIKYMKGSVTALKVTIIREGSVKCPRGGSGCGVCTSLESDYAITEETDLLTGKDTSKLLAAGAEKVYWLRVKEHAVLAGIEKILTIIDKSEPVICESNSILKYITPSLFFLLKAQNGEMKKKSALSVEDKADLIIETTIESSNFDFLKLNFSDSKWSMRS